MGSAALHTLLYLYVCFRHRGTVDAQGMLRVLATLGGGVCRPVGLLPGWESGLDRRLEFETGLDLS